MTRSGITGSDVRIGLGIGVGHLIIGTLLAGLVIPVLGVAGCNEPVKFQPPPPPTVTVAKPIRQTVTSFFELPGRTIPMASVDVRARVPGYLKQVHFEEGQDVEAGMLLFTIEPAEYEAELQSAQAAVQTAEAEQIRAESEFTRIERLHRNQNAAETEFVNARAALSAAQADILAQQAALQQAELNLSYTQVTAPMAGRIGRKMVDEGNLVGQGDPTVLTDIVAWNPIQVEFSADERDVLDWRRRIAREGRRDRVPVLLRLADGSKYPIAGRVDYVDNEVDPTTGTLTIRAVFDNPDRILVPGLFVRARVPELAPDALLVPELAVLRDSRGHFVLLVDEAGKVQRSEAVQVGLQVGTMRVIEGGLEDDARVIVNGLQRARPGADVKVETVQLEPPADELDPAEIAPKPGYTESFTETGDKPAAGQSGSEASTSEASASEANKPETGEESSGS